MLLSPSDALALEYADGVRPYLFCHNPDHASAIKQLYIYKYSARFHPDDISPVTLSFRPFRAPVDYLRLLLNLDTTLSPASSEFLPSLLRGDGLLLVGKLLNDFYTYHDTRLIPVLLSLCMGAQYFSIVVSPLFPFHQSDSVQLAKFYSYVVLGDQKKAVKTYPKIEKYLSFNLSRVRDLKSLVLGNIFCLFLLRSGQCANDILRLNEELVERAQGCDDKALLAILLLNQSRLLRLMGRNDHSVLALTKSFAYTSDIPLFKLRLYYVLQLARIRGLDQRLTSHLLRISFNSSGGEEALSWRLSKLMLPSLNADMILVRLHQDIVDILLANNELPDLLNQLSHS